MGDFYNEKNLESVDGYWLPFAWKLTRNCFFMRTRGRSLRMGTKYKPSMSLLVGIDKIFDKK